MTTPVKRFQSDNSYSLSAKSRIDKKTAKGTIMGYTWAPIPVLSSNANNCVDGNNTQAMGFVLGPAKKSSTKKPVQENQYTTIYEGKIIKLLSICGLNAAQLEQFEVMQVMMETVLSNFGVEELQELVFCRGKFLQNGEYMAKLEAIVQINNYHITKAYIENGLLCLVVCHDVSGPKSMEKLPHTVVPDFNGSASQGSNAEATITTPVVGEMSIDSISENDSDEKTFPYGFGSPTLYQQPVTVSSSVLDGLSYTNSLVSPTQNVSEIDEHTAKFHKRLNSFWSSPDGPNKTINQPGSASGSWLRKRNVSKIPVYNKLSSKKKQSVFTRPLPPVPSALPKIRKGKGVATQPEHRVSSKDSTGAVVKKSPIIGFRPKRCAGVGVATQAQLDLFWGPNRRAGSHVSNKNIDKSANHKIGDPKPVINAATPPTPTGTPTPTPTVNSVRSTPRIFLTEIDGRNKSISWESVQRPIETRERPISERTNDSDQQITSPPTPKIITRKYSMETVQHLHDDSVGKLIYNPRKFTSLTNLRRRASEQAPSSRAFNMPQSAPGKATENPTGIPSPVGRPYHPGQTRSQKLWSDLVGAKKHADREEPKPKANTLEASSQAPTYEKHRAVTPKHN